MFKDNKKFVLESIFIKEALKQDLSLNEFLLLMYFDNSFDSIFNIQVIGKSLSMSEYKIQVKNLHKAFGKKVVLDGVDLEIKKDPALPWGRCFETCYMQVGFLPLTFDFH